MGQRERFERAVLALHEAQFDDSRWPAAAALADDAYGGKGNHLSVIRAAPGHDAEFVFGKLYKHGEPDDELERFYVENYLPIDERMPRFFRMPDNELNHVNALFTDEERKSSPTYNEFVVPSGSANALNVRMAGPGGLHVIWVLVNAGGPSSWATEQIATVRELLPHVRHFVRVRQALADAGAGALDAATAALGAKGLGVVLLDRRGLVAEANDSARALLRRGNGLADRRGHLIPAHKADADNLARLVATALAREPAVPEGGTMSIRRRGRPSLAVHVTPLLAGGNAALGAMGGFAAIMLIVDPRDKPRVSATRLAQALDLTPAQARVAAAIASGGTVQSVAAASHRSEAVVRWHLKQIMARLGLFGQTDLVRLVLTTPGVFTSR